MHNCRMKLNSKVELSKHANDLGPLDESCPCPTCTGKTSRAILHHTVTHETAAAHGKLAIIDGHIVSFTNTLVQL